MKQLLAIATASFLALAIFGCQNDGTPTDAAVTAPPAQPVMSPASKTGAPAPGKAPTAELSPTAGDARWAAGTNIKAGGK